MYLKNVEQTAPSMALTEHPDDASETTLGGKIIIKHYIKNLTHTLMARESKVICR